MHAANCRRRYRPQMLMYACMASMGLAAVLTMTLTVGCNAPTDPPTGNDNTNSNTNTNDNANTNDNSTPDNPLARTCVGCHTDEALLRQVARVEPPPPPSTP